MMNNILISLSALAFSAAVQAGGPWRASEANTRGWQLMTPEERIEHQARIRSFRTYEECQSYRLAHHEKMEERARQSGRELPRGRRDFCDHLQADKASR